MSGLSASDLLLGLADKNKDKLAVGSAHGQTLDKVDQDDFAEPHPDPLLPTGFRRFLLDWRSITLLLFFYTLQGLPLGLQGSVPLIIQSRNVTYQEQAKFSLSDWPFSLKLLWAPLVDALYWGRMGRRKSWLIPAQYLIGGMMFLLSYQVDGLLDEKRVGMLTMYFFVLNFLTATQDVAVDGWGLTMLRRENVGLASTCNAVGISFGIFLGYAVFLNLASPEFSNDYLRTKAQKNDEVGVVTLASFLFGWSCVYFVATSLILVFKKEEKLPLEDKNGDGGKNTIVASYFRLWFIIKKLPSVRKCILFYFTASIGFAAVSSMSDLKLVEAGLPKEVRALMSVPLTPISLFLPFLISKWTAGAKPMSVFMKAYCFGLAFSGVIAVMVWVTSSVKDSETGLFPAWYFPTLLGIEALFRVCRTIMFVAKMAFIAKISDPAHGATFMTLYNTVSNLGSSWPNSIALALVDPLTVESCEVGESGDSVCTKAFDGYYTETIACIVIGFVWFFWGKVAMDKLQKKPESSWRLDARNNPCIINRDMKKGNDSTDTPTTTSTSTIS